ncbi:25711_t:CDS:2, partial [Racocetra persica]
ALEEKFAIGAYRSAERSEGNIVITVYNRMCEDIERFIKKRIIDLEAENTKLNNIIKESIRREAEHAKLKKDTTNLKAENAELKAEVTKLRHDIEEIKKKDQTVTDTQDASSTEDISNNASNSNESKYSDEYKPIHTEFK